MAVYVDNAVIPWRGRLWAHLLASDLDELHAMAAAIGMRRAWFQDGGRFPHYDVTAEGRAAALELGAVPIVGRRIPGDVLMRRGDGRLVPRAEVLAERAGRRSRSADGSRGQPRDMRTRGDQWPTG
ncbi:MAG TPA: DUF4031 domain-containing protein [Capillimicrobium sp.]|jgi:hypothetical protein